MPGSLLAPGSGHPFCFFQAEDGIRGGHVTGVQTCALPISFAKSPRHADVLEGIAAARQVGFGKLKLNSVVIRGFNDDELVDLIEFGRAHDAEVRFIEYMDVGGATRWSMDQVVSQRDMLETLGRRYGAIQPLSDDSHSPAERFRLPDGTTFGIIASTTAPFCRSCDRSRVTADGTWLLCLYD